MKKFNLLSAIGSAVICGVCALAFNDSSHMNKEYNDTNNVIESNVSMKRASYRETRDSSYAANPNGL